MGLTSTAVGVKWRNSFAGTDSCSRAMGTLQIGSSGLQLKLGLPSAEYTSCIWAHSNKMCLNGACWPHKAQSPSLSGIHCAFLASDWYPPAICRHAVCWRSVGNFATVRALVTLSKAESPAVSLRCAALHVANLSQDFRKSLRIKGQVVLMRLMRINLSVLMWPSIVVVHPNRFSVRLSTPTGPWIALNWPSCSCNACRKVSTSAFVARSRKRRVFRWVLHLLHKSVASNPWGCTALGSPHHYLGELGTKSEVFVPKRGEFGTK